MCNKTASQKMQNCGSPLGLPQPIFCKTHKLPIPPYSGVHKRTFKQVS